jgi:hypothetical protein
MDTTTSLDPQQQGQAERIYQALMKAAASDLRGIAELLASKPDHQVLGRAEFQVRDLVHALGAKAIQAALDERKKGGTAAPA